MAVRNHEKNREQNRAGQNDLLEEFKRKQRICWWMNALGWWVLGVNVVLQVMLENKILFGIGVLIGIIFIVAGVIYSTIHRLYRCPYCGGILLRYKCLGCGKRMVVVPKR
ncbi:MAG: hypothetical protein IJ147_09085 [Lachnospiraceae bacterium]|nr:hypothetical protein [Lachnospiraceae bacterium]